MHSKVIIASLVCMLAASFGNSKIANAPRPVHAATEEVAFRAPNDLLAEVTFDNRKGDVGTYCSATIEFERELFDFEILEQSEYLDSEYVFADDFAIVDIAVPSVAGSHYVKFGYYDDTNQYVVASIFIYVSGTHYYASALSADDAKANYFLEYVASVSERLELLGLNQYQGGFEHDPIDVDPPIIVIPPIPDPGPNPPRVNSNKSGGSSGSVANLNGGLHDHVIDFPGIQTAAFLTPQERFSNYVYNSSNDFTTSVSYEPVSRFFYEGTQIETNVRWIDENNNAHPARWVKAQLVTDRKIGNKTLPWTLDNLNTNSQGTSSVLVSESTASQYKMTDLRVELTANNPAAYLHDASGIDYKYFYRFTNSSLFNTPYLNDYSKVTLNIDIYPGRSDRADAFEIAEAETLPFNYCDGLSDGVNIININFPAKNSEYVRNSASYSSIKIKKEDAHSWDVLNHEYGHYICDKLGLAENIADRMPHNVDADLISLYGETDGKKLAYAEGLATFIGIASQYHDRARDFNIPGVADMIYQDPFRHLEVHYGEYTIGRSEYYEFIPQGYETSVTGTLLKIFQVTLNAYNFSTPAYAEPWAVLRNSDTNIDSVLETYIQRNPALTNDIRSIMSRECFFGDENFPHPDPWTIMIYLCGSDLESRFGAATEDIAEMLSVAGQPENVNIVIQTGGSPIWWDYDIPSNRIGRYEVRNGSLVSLEDPTNPFEQQYMGREETFEQFLTWGLDNYPAEKTGVILWNHGGAVDGCCYDVYDGYDSLKNSEASVAFQHAITDRGLDKLEFIGYDCCLMQDQDTAAFNSNYFNYMVASEESEGGDGWEYDKWLGSLYNLDETEDILKTICDSYIQYSGYHDYGTMSILDLSKMAAYRSAFEQLMINMKPAIDNDRQAFNSVINSTYKFAGFDDYGQIDGYGFFINLLNCGTFNYIYASEIVDVLQAYLQVVIYNVTEEGALGNALGLAIHVCLPNTYQTYLQEDSVFHAWRHVFGLHNFTYITFVTENLHVKVCGDCDYYELEEHEIDEEWWEDGHHFAHCSICDSVFMYH